MQAFQQAVLRNEPELNLAEAALLIASIEYPALDPAPYLTVLGEFAREAAAITTSLPSRREKLAAANALLFDTLGFRGNRDNYYDPRNSFLNEVINRRTGIPITLSVIHLEVCWRLGIPVQGVGMPGHFIVGYWDNEGEILIDPFNGGRVLTTCECESLVSASTNGQVEFRPEHLAPVTKKRILARMLANLLGVYARGCDYGRALRVIDYALVLEPGSAAHLRDRGLILIALGRHREAAAELQRYLELAPDAPEREVLVEQIKTSRRDLARLN
jgi:regulator of sirC expression with transglutaminase-like and TPR domain